MPPWITILPGAEIAVIAMAFAWGAVLGSFVNVVLHRLPRGRSVATDGSRCPACGAAIRPRDNIPVIGWMLLRGCCRDCGAAISIRYPLVEAACGGIAAVVTASEIAGWGGGLPLLDAGRPGIDRLLLHGDWRPLLSTVLHTVILIAMVTWSLLAWDAASRMRRHAATRSPRETGTACAGAAWLAVVVVATVTAVPGIGPVGVWMDGGFLPSAGGCAASFVAAAVGLSAGRILGGFSGGAADRCGLAVFGAATGWQAVTVVSIVTTVARWACRRVTREGGLGEAVAGVAVAGTVLWCWRPLHGWWTTTWPIIAGR